MSHQVDTDHDRCMVSFEDESEFWVLYKDLQQAHNQNDDQDITCFLCSVGTSESPNEIVICDRCGRGRNRTSVWCKQGEPWCIRHIIFYLVFFSILLYAVMEKCCSSDDWESRKGNRFWKMHCPKKLALYITSSRIPYPKSMIMVFILSAGKRPAM